MKREILAILALLLIVLLWTPSTAQNTAYPVLTGSSLPALCPINSLFFKTTPPGGLYFCVSPNTWVPTAFVAPGQITLITSGTCPFAFSEVTALDGKTVIGTLAAHGDVGTAGGSDSITPNGTVGAIAASASAPDLVASGSNFKVADTGHTHPAPAFTGAAFDNRSAFVKVIFCSKD